MLTATAGSDVTELLAREWSMEPAQVVSKLLMYKHFGPKTGDHADAIRAAARSNRLQVHEPESGGDRIAAGASNRSIAGTNSVVYGMPSDTSGFAAEVLRRLKASGTPEGHSATLDLHEHGLPVARAFRNLAMQGNDAVMQLIKCCDEDEFVQSRTDVVSLRRKLAAVDPESTTGGLDSLALKVLQSGVLGLTVDVQFRPRMVVRFLDVELTHCERAMNVLLTKLREASIENVDEFGGQSTVMCEVTF